MGEQSLAMELINDYKKQNKRLFIIIITILVLWFATIGGFVYYICNYRVEEITEISEVETDSGNANACIGDNCNNGVVNGESKSDKNN